MCPRRPHPVLFALAALPAVVTLLPLPAFAQLRVVNHNLHGAPTSTFDPNKVEFFQVLAAEQRNGIARRPAVFALQEVYDNRLPNYLSFLNQAYGGQGANYASVQIRAGSIGSSANYQAFVYDTTQVQLLSWDSVAAGTRPGLLGRFRPVGYSSAAADLWLYNVHLKAFPGFEGTRLGEVQTMKAIADFYVGNAGNLINLGDFNFTSQQAEPAYAEMIGSSQPRAFDPALWTPSQNTYSTSGPSSRIDFQFPTLPLGDGEGLDLIGDGPSNHSYWAFGNDGSFETPQYIRSMSDHLAVVADYQVPAKMQVQAAPVAPRVLVGAAATVNLTIANTAPVVAANGADELDYTVSGTGAVIGSDAGTDLALGGAASESIALDTASAGNKSGVVQVQAADPATESPTASSSLTYQVLDHANGSFHATADRDTLLIDFGTITPGSATQSAAASLHNLAATAGFTAKLDLDGIIEVDPQGRFTLLLNNFSGLAAGSGVPLTASFEPDLAAGVFTASYTLLVSDEDLPGAWSRQLRLDLRAEVIPEPATAGLLAATAWMALVGRRRR